MTAAAVLVASDPARGLLRLGFTGLLDDPALDRMEAELDRGRRELERRGLSAQWPRVLVDARGAGVQTRAAADRLRARMARFGGSDRHIAFVTGGASLLRLQLARLAEGERFAFFDAEEEATAWLFAG